ncbi:MAG: hypothetical protein ACI9S8_001972 [Chlamydiales bacterium]|jgi:hypothetical protein
MVSFNNNSAATYMNGFQPRKAPIAYTVAPPLLRFSYTPSHYMCSPPPVAHATVNPHTSKISGIQNAIAQLRESSEGLSSENLQKINSLFSNITQNQIECLRQNDHFHKGQYEQLINTIHNVVDILGKTPLRKYMPARNLPAPIETQFKPVLTPSHLRTMSNASINASTAVGSPRSSIASSPRLSPAHSPYLEPITSDKVNQLVQKLYGMENLVWDYKQDGCYARATLTIDELKKMGIPEDKLGLQVITGPNLGVLLPNGKNIHWRFHIAATVKLDNGKCVVIDPSVDSNKVLGAGEWASHIKKDNIPLPTKSTLIHPNSKHNSLADSKKYTFVHIPSDCCFNYNKTSHPGFINLLVNKVDSAAKLRFQNVLAENKRKLKNMLAEIGRAFNSLTEKKWPPPYSCGRSYAAREPHILSPHSYNYSRMVVC